MRIIDEYFSWQILYGDPEHFVAVDWEGWGKKDTEIWLGIIKSWRSESGILLKIEQKEGPKEEILQWLREDIDAKLEQQDRIFQETGRWAWGYEEDEQRGHLFLDAKPLEWGRRDGEWYGAKYLRLDNGNEEILEEVTGTRQEALNWFHKQVEKILGEA